MKKLLLLAMLFMANFTALASVPACYSSHNGYCQYTGKVSRIYVNSDNLILLYFDTAMDPAEGSIASMSLSSGSLSAKEIFSCTA